MVTLDGSKCPSLSVLVVFFAYLTCVCSLFEKEMERVAFYVSSVNLFIFFPVHLSITPPFINSD